MKSPFKFSRSWLTQPSRTPTKLPRAALAITKEAARHLLRRPVLTVTAAAQTDDGRCLLIRRRDTGRWAMPGGTVEWGETVEQCIRRELLEEAGASVTEMGELLGVYSHPRRDFRFHAATVVVGARIDEPQHPPKNPLEIADVGLFERASLPKDLSLNHSDMLDNALSGKVVWE